MACPQGTLTRLDRATGKRCGASAALRSAAWAARAGAIGSDKGECWLTEDGTLLEKPNVSEVLSAPQAEDMIVRSGDGALPD
jgi:hypothetical protein